MNSAVGATYWSPIGTGEEIDARFVRHKPRTVGGRFYQTHPTLPAPICFADADWWIVEFEQGGKKRAEYGEALLERLSADLTAKFRRGFPGRISTNMASLFSYPEIRPTLSGESVAGNAQALPAIANTRRGTQRTRTSRSLCSASWTISHPK